METWKRALIFGSLGAGAALFISGRRPAGIGLVGVGLAALAFDQRAKLGGVLKNLPELADRTTQIVERLAQFGEQIAERIQSESESAWSGV